MEAAPNPIDVQDFQFKLHSRVKIFKENNGTFDKTYNLVAAASRFGLIFVGSSSNNFQVLLLKHLEDYSEKNADSSGLPKRTVQLPSIPTYLSVNCDNTKLCVVVEKENCCTAFIYDIPSFLKQEIFVNREIRLSPTPGVFITECCWNPTIPEILTVCKSDKSLALYELKPSGIDINEIPSAAGVTCLCWSPKGKQLAVGSQDGKITQYKPDLKAVKVINSPPLPETNCLVSLQWISNYQFIGVYTGLNAEARANLIVVDAPKVGETKYTNYEDICYSYGNSRFPQFYMVHQATWNILMVASSNSMEVGILGSSNNQWNQWMLIDSARAELPLSADHRETLPVGLVFDTGCTKPIPWGESTLPPAPYLYILSHFGVLCCFSVVNVRDGAIPLCKAPEFLSDTSGMPLFVKDAPQEVRSPIIVTPVKPQVPKAVPISVVPQIEPQAPVPLVIPQPKPQSFFGTQPVSFTSKPSQPLAEMKANPQQIVSFSNPQPIIEKPQPVMATTPKVTARRSTARASQKPEAKTSEMPVAVADKEDTEKLIAQMVREECQMLRAELKATLHKGRSLKVAVGSESESENLVRKIQAIQNFLDEVSEASNTQAAEIHCLKQQLIQTWAWFEEARSRFAASKDETMASLLRAQPLDPASQYHLQNITHLMYYLESQLTQANNALDEQWEMFQDSCKKTYKMQIPTMEKIFQSMVRQNAILQKQIYKLKDLSSRLQVFTKNNETSAHLISLKSSEDLEEKLKNLKLEPQDLFEVEYQRVLNKQKHFSSEKIAKLENLLSNHTVAHVTVIKPEITALTLTPQKKGLGFPVTEIIHSTPKPKEVAPKMFGIFEPKDMTSQPLESVKTITPAAVASIGGAVPNFGIPTFSSTSAGSGITQKTFFQPKPVLATTTGSAFASTVQAPSIFESKGLTITPVPAASTATTTKATGGETFSFASAKSLSKPSAVPATTSTAFTPKTTASVYNLYTAGNAHANLKPEGSKIGTKLPENDPYVFECTPLQTMGAPYVFDCSLFFPASPKFNFATKDPGPPGVAIFGSPTTTSSTAAQTTTPSSAAVATTDVSSTPAPKIDANPTSIFSQTTTTTVVTTPTATTPAATSPFNTFKFSTATTKPNAFADFYSSSLFGDRTPVSTTVTASEGTTVTAAEVVPKITPATPAATTTAPNAFNFTVLSSSILGAPPTTTTTTSAPTNVFGPAPTTTTSIFAASIPALSGVPSTAGKLFSTGPATTSSEKNIFGGTAATSTSGSMFGSNATGNLFQSSTSTPNTTFGTSTTAPTTNTAGTIFGVPPTTTNGTGSIFGASITPATTGTTVFGITPTTTSNTGSIFGTSVTPITTTTAGNIFGTNTPSTTGNIFGSPTVAVTSVFGGTPKTTSEAFGSASPVFGATTPPFGTGSTFVAPQSSATSVFGQTGTSFGTSGSSIFAKPAVTTAPFGGTTATTSSQMSTFNFASASAGVPSSNSAFGSFSFGELSVGSPTTTSSGFGFDQQPPNPFGRTSAQEQSSSIFGSPAATSSGSIFGTNTGSTFGSPQPFSSGSIFGSSSSTFGQQSTFGQGGFGSGGSLFGSPSVQPQGAFSSGSQSVAQTGFGASASFQKPSGFGAPPVFGAGASPTGFGAPPSFGSPPAFGNQPAFGSPGKSFGGSPQSSFSSPVQQQSSSFANLANQNTLGFGSLAQSAQTPGESNVFAKSSSFSSWR